MSQKKIVFRRIAKPLIKWLFRGVKNWGSHIMDTWGQEKYKEELRLNGKSVILSADSVSLGMLSRHQISDEYHK